MMLGLVSMDVDVPTVLLAVVFLTVIVLGIVCILLWDQVSQNKRDCDEDRKRLFRLEKDHQELRVKSATNEMLLNQMRAVWEQMGCGSSTCNMRHTIHMEEAIQCLELPPEGMKEAG